MSPELQADLARWAEKKRLEKDQRESRGKAPGTFDEVRAELQKAFEQLPDKVEIPFALTPEGERMAKFKRLLEDAPEFLQRIDPTKLPNPTAFDAVAKWDGVYPGPCAFGGTDTGKTRAAWSALGRLYVRENRTFAWFPVRRLVTEFQRYEDSGHADEFFRMYSFFDILFIDDVDKINWAFDSQKMALFAFWDWVYRKNKPVIATTNHPREWWDDRMGEAFSRRLFKDAHFPVQFDQPATTTRVPL